LSYGGPIKKNKTFFFVLYDQQIRNQRSTITGTVLTDTARQGIFRYFEGYNNGNFSTATTFTSTPSIAVVNFDGTPKAPLYAPGTGSATASGTPYTGRLKCFSVFGTIKTDGSPFTAADCPGGDAIFPPGTTYWDPNRQTADRTGFIKKFLDFMPRANYFNTGDGLNTAGIRWLRGNNANQGGFFGLN